MQLFIVSQEQESIIAIIIEGTIVHPLYSFGTPSIIYPTKLKFDAFGVPIDVHCNVWFPCEKLFNTEKEKIRSNNNQSISGNLNLPSTYVNSVTSLNNFNLPGLKNSSYFAKVAFRKDTDENYYPYLYINKGGKESVIEVKTYSKDLQYLMEEFLPQYATPANIEANLINKK